MHPIAPGPTAPARASRTTAIGLPQLLVVAALVIAVAWPAVVTTWEPRGFWAGLLLRSVPFGLALLAFGAAVLSTRGRWRRPAELTLTGGARLRVPPGPGFGWFVAGQVLVLASATVPVADFDWLDDPDAPPAPLRYALVLPPAVMLAVAALLIGVLVAAVFSGRPRVDLTPSGIEVREPFGRRTIPWVALCPGTPARQSTGDQLVLTVTRPELVERRGLLLGSRTAPRLVLAWLRVHPWFLADAIRYYVDHSDERDAIGEPEGYERLRRALA
ncbi:PH domain-containing protein [Micromonospora peucetia]|uniref:PH domain-containing protein n=1 Tax=Micromonospora peucetia TaxID=47871 RepID=UPI00225BD337|nr:PH domain-containing protein [Micromonospora peucetia]MCX4385488.1 PH domain-containing protein [Micromonospora peucetia]